MTEMGEMGLFAPTLPEQYGGGEVSYVALRVDRAEIERIDSGYRSAYVGAIKFGDLSHLCLQRETQRQKYLPKLMQGEWIGCFGLT